MYSSANSGGFKREQNATTPVGSWHLYTLNADYGASSLALHLDGVAVTLQSNGTNLAGSSGIAPDSGTVTMDVAQVIIAHGLTVGQIAQLEAYLLAEAGL
jgi:hypothetical protein